MLLRTTRRRLFTFASMVLLVPVVALAHHSYTAEFDTTKPIKLSGVLTRVEWANPHIWLYLDVKDDKGNVTNWGFSASPPGMLQRRGITKNSLKLGDVLTITGHRAKDGSNTINAGSVVLPDGKKVFAGSAEDGAPAPK